MCAVDTLRILVVDDHPFMRSVLRSVFERNNAFSIIAVGEDFDAAVQAASGTTPDVVLTDIHMKPVDGVELTRYFVRRFPGVPVIGFSNTFFNSDIKAMTDAGAASVISKDIAVADLYRTLLGLKKRPAVSTSNPYPQ